MMLDEVVTKAPITALVYETGDPQPGPLLAAIAHAVAARGGTPAGVIEHLNDDADDGPAPHRCDVRLEVLGMQTSLALSENRGRGARGCRLDADALMRAVQLTQAALEGGADILLVNKFGKMEAEGGGFRDAIGEAVARGVPVLIGVPARNLDAFRAFAGGLAVEMATGSMRIDSGTDRVPVAFAPQSTAS
ncbi:MAG TPA: DUF2478 domain-containing protein [Micropepsaceae bacterium]|nr:DUF2478 domain-containing protein [Micropepsaceae bacterium]